jgi:hypothetical protein
MANAGSGSIRRHSWRPWSVQRADFEPAEAERGPVRRAASFARFTINRSAGGGTWIPANSRPSFMPNHRTPNGGEHGARTVEAGQGRSLAAGFTALFQGSRSSG